MANKTITKILLDADVIIHFVKGGQQLILPNIFPEYSLCVLDKVSKELKYRSEYKNLFNFGTLTEIPFPNDNPDIRKEYALLLKSKKGDGESACLAYLRFNPDILGSSNIKDIKAYCEEHQIKYLTTMDFICEANKKGILSEEECNEFIKLVISKGSILPCKSFYEYDCDTRSIIDIGKIGK